MSYIQYISGDVFQSTDSLVHCVSADLRMGAGIAVEFKKRFGQLETLYAQAEISPNVRILQDGARYIFYLVTKSKYHNKPTYDSLKKSLLDLKTYCITYNVSKLSMPKIGCGLDGLNWTLVEHLLQEIFGPTTIQLTVYSL